MKTRPRFCIRCGCPQLHHNDEGCLGHLKCKTGIAGNARYFTERRSPPSKTKKTVADFEQKRSEPDA